MDTPSFPAAPAPAPPGGPEELLWEGHPSQWMNLGHYILMVLVCLLVVPILILLHSLRQSSAGGEINLWLGLAAGCWTVVPLLFFAARWLRTRCTHISVTTQRLRMQTGVFSRKTEDVELYRVKDLTLQEPLYQRSLGLASILISSTDISTPTIELKGLPQGAAVYEKLRAAVENRRASRRVSVTELE